jgi:hypothetical protein
VIGLLSDNERCAPYDHCFLSLSVIPQASSFSPRHETFQAGRLHHVYSRIIYTVSHAVPSSYPHTDVPNAKTNSTTPMNHRKTDESIIIKCLVFTKNGEDSRKQDGTPAHGGRGRVRRGRIAPIARARRHRTSARDELWASHEQGNLSHPEGKFGSSPDNRHEDITTSLHLFACFTDKEPSFAEYTVLQCIVLNCRA